MTTPPRPLSKTAQKRADAAKRREAREAKRQNEALRVQVAREKARELIKRMPPEFQDWGVMRTRAYAQLLGIIGSKIDNKTLTASAMESLLDTAAKASTWTLQFCQHIASLHANAATLGELEA